MTNYFHEVFTDVDQRGSFKRLVTFFSFLILVSMYVANTFFVEQINETILQAFQTITMSGLAAIAAERFGKFIVNKDSIIVKKEDAS